MVAAAAAMTGTHGGSNHASEPASGSQGISAAIIFAGAVTMLCFVGALLGDMAVKSTFNVRCKRTSGNASGLSGYTLMTEIEVEDNIVFPPVATLDHLILVSATPAMFYGDATIYVFDRLTGSQLWSQPMDDTRVSQIVANDTVLAALVDTADTTKLMVFDLQTGAFLWEADYI